MGVIFATYFAERVGLADEGYFQNVLDWSRPYFADYVTKIEDVPADLIVDAMKQDKKNSGDQVTFILSRRPGIMEKVALDARAIPALINDCRRLL